MIVDDLANAILKTMRGSYNPRMRIAVSPKEYEEIRDYMLTKFGRFHGRILNVPMIVEENPESPPDTVQV